MWECTVHDSGHEESTVACKLKRLFTVPDVGLEESTVPLKWNRLFTVPDVLQCQESITECGHVQYVTVDLKKVH